MRERHWSSVLGGLVKSSVRTAALMISVACAARPHSTNPTVASAQCADKQAAIRTAHSFASQTEQDDRVKLRVDESRTVEKPGEWRVWTFVESTWPWGDAYLVVHKADCKAEWALLLQRID
jgi:hypothetical protein